MRTANKFQMNRISDDLNRQLEDLRSELHRVSRFEEDERELRNIAIEDMKDRVTTLESTTKNMSMYPHGRDHGGP